MTHNQRYEITFPATAEDGAHLNHLYRAKEYLAIRAIGAGATVVGIVGTVLWDPYAFGLLIGLGVANRT